LLVFFWKGFHHQLIRIIYHLTYGARWDTVVHDHGIPHLLIHMVSGLNGMVLLSPFDGFLGVTLYVEFQYGCIEAGQQKHFSLDLKD